MLTLRRRSGFSLIEIMVVVVIIGILAGAVALKVGQNVARARVNVARSDVATLAQAVESARLHTGRLPTAREGLSGLDVTSTLDPWGNPYQYNAPGPDGHDYEVVSYGADGREGGEGEDADVVSWQLEADRANGAAGGPGSNRP